MLNSYPKPVSLQRGLASLPLEDLAAIGEHVGLQEELTSKARLLGGVPARLTDRSTVRRLIRELEAASAKALFVAAACEKLAPSLGARLVFRFGTTSPPRAAVTRALLLPDASSGLYRPPAEILPHVHDEAVKKLAGPGARPPRSPVNLEPLSAFRDAVAVWCHTIKNPITLTQSGATPKRALAKLSPLLEVAEEEAPLSTVVERFGFNRLEFLVNDAERRGALKREGDVLHATNWLTADLRGVADDYNAELVRGAVEEDETGGALLAVYICSLSRTRRWRPLEGVVENVINFSTGFEEAAIRKALFSLFVSGFATAGFDDGGALLVARSAAFEGREAPRAKVAEPEFLLGGNFELKVAYDAPTETRLKLEAFADQTGGGRFPSYLISKSSFYRALDAGVAVEEILTFLKEHASAPVPQNVEFSLNDWAQQYGTFSFYDGLVVVTDEAEKADEVANLPGVAPLVKGRREFHAVEIARADYRAVREALTSAGYLPRSLRSEAEGDVSPRALFDAG
ncbi:MAG: hypothetical protein GTN49_11720 [candidate division Zixibacteria bacterium]|nr:hypothetical protein [candidate division Zixibacteria bacterium]